MATVTSTHSFACADASEVTEISDYLTKHLAAPELWDITTVDLTVTASITAEANL